MELTNEFEVPVTLDDAWEVLTDVERIAPCLPGAELKEVEGDEYRGIVKVKVGPITASYKGSARFIELDKAAHRAVLKAEGRETRGQGNASATITATLDDSGGSGTKVSVVTDLNITGKVAQFGRGVLADVSGKLLEQFVSNLEASVLSPGTGDLTGRAVPDPVEEPASTPSRSRASSGSADSSPGDVAGTAPAGTEPAGLEATDIEANGARPSGAESPGAEAAHSEPTVRQIDSPPAQPVDLVEVAGSSLRKRVLPYASIAGGIFLLRIVIYALRRRKK
ncbi:MAG: SRPBCC family protein [Acidimicrobiales bacterium]